MLSGVSADTTRVEFLDERGDLDVAALSLACHLYGRDHAGRRYRIAMVEAIIEGRLTPAQARAHTETWLWLTDL